MRPVVEAAAAPDAGQIFATHGEFLFATLQRLGVRDADLSDMLQEVLVVVMQRLHSYDPSRPLPPWLFGICVRVVAAQRRRAYVRRELLVDAVPDAVDTARADDDAVAGTAWGADPEQSAAAREGHALLQSVLDAMDLERRAVFVMFEVEGLRCEQIAATMGVPVGTVYSRLHAARKEFSDQLARWRARTTRGGAR